jgi:hypothetical protein
MKAVRMVNAIRQSSVSKFERREIFHFHSMDSRSVTTNPVVAGGVRFNCENNFAIASGLESNLSIVFPVRLLVVRSFMVPVKPIGKLAFRKSSVKSIVIPRYV